MTPYLTIQFSFTPDTLEWVKIESMKVFEKYQQDAVNEGGQVPLTLSQKRLWYTSKAWDEICEHMAPFNFEYPYDLQFFIYKPGPVRTDIRGNPHFDNFEITDINNIKPVPFRFNILINGTEDQEMVWWNVLPNDSNIELSKFNSHFDTKVFSYRYQVKGSTLAERWDNIGPPDWTNASLTKYNKWASFVRTDLCHGINWTRGYNPRFLVSVRFKDSWDKIEEMRNMYPEDQVKKIGP